MRPEKTFMRFRLILLASLISIVTSLNTGFAQNLLMIRVENPFPETMVALQAAIQAQGYTISRVQRVDVGLTKSGYQTDLYRIVFFGKADEIQKLSLKYPTLVPYLPLKIVIFAEGEDTLILANNMTNLDSFFRKRELRRYFRQWSHDTSRILERVATTAAD
ncbi:MAG: DUF302 domain-containing protein [Gammaproteobacteria bacterium]|nr:DUF302 domain-containing protein [Gammaproteobacteria bacterium]